MRDGVTFWGRRYNTVSVASHKNQDKPGTGLLVEEVHVLSFQLTHDVHCAPTFPTIS